MKNSASAPPPAGRSSLRRIAAALDTDAALYLGLLFLVWGLTVAKRGLWQDDTLLLRLARDFQGHGWAAAFTPVVTPLRRLYSLPFLLALGTPQPVWTLHLLFGLTWLGQALAAGWILRLLLPGQQLARFLAICLTLTATSDYLTNNLTALGYNLAALALLLAIGCALRYLEGGGAGWLALSCAAVAISLWTVDVAFPALPFVPLLLLWRGGLSAWRRLLIFGLAWTVTIAPAAWIEWRFLRSDTGYAAVAIQSMPLAERLARTAHLWCENFEPWRWAFARPNWYPRPSAAIPLWAFGLAAALGAAGFAVRAWRARPQAPSTGNLRTLSLAGLFALLTLVANAAYAGLQMAELHYRTHILSRVGCSLTLAVCLGWAIQRWTRFRPAFLLVPACFVGLGIWGGMERQDLWVSTWRMHKKELLSIVTNAPALRPGTSLILRREGPHANYLATEAEYLAQSWLILLYDDPALHSLLLAPEHKTECRADSGALACRHEGDLGRLAAESDRFPYDTLVIMDFDEKEGVYRLLARPRGDPLFASVAAAAVAYRPAERIVRRPLTARQRALLLR